MKLQVLYYSPKGVVRQLAESIGKELKCKCDQIPPAYPCENEKLVLIGVEGYKKPSPQFVDFCKTMTAERAKNIAFFKASNTGSEGVEDVKALMKNNKGVNIISDVFECPVKAGLFGAGKVTEKEMNDVSKWAHKIVDQFFE